MLTRLADYPEAPCYDFATLRCPPPWNAWLPSARIFRFGRFEADAGRGTLSRGGLRVRLQEQPFHVLILLLERPGEIITREELRQQLWPEGTYVDFDGSLNAILKKLRAALDDDSDNPRFIETVPRRGYRFIAPVTVESVAVEPPASANGASAGGSGRTPPPKNGPGAEQAQGSAAAPPYLCRVRCRASRPGWPRMVRAS